MITHLEDPLPLMGFHGCGALALIEASPVPVIGFASRVHLFQEWSLRFSLPFVLCMLFRGALFKFWGLLTCCLALITVCTAPAIGF